MSDLDIDKAAALTSAAMVHTPSYKQLFRGSDEWRQSALRYFFKRNFEIIQSRDPTTLHYVVDDDGELECFFMLIPNDAANLTWWDKVVHFFEFPFMYGFDALLRGIQLGRRSDGLEKEVMADYPKYLCLQRMVVAPHKQGSGIGSKNLNKVLVEVADKMQLPVMLSTQEARNVTFYARLNFKVVKESDFVSDDEQYNFHSYFMIRLPQPVN